MRTSTLSSPPAPAVGDHLALKLEVTALSEEMTVLLAARSRSSSASSRASPAASPARGTATSRAIAPTRPTSRSASRPTSRSSVSHSALVALGALRRALPPPLRRHRPPLLALTARGREMLALCVARLLSDKLSVANVIAAAGGLTTRRARTTRRKARMSTRTTAPALTTPTSPPSALHLPAPRRPSSPATSPSASPSSTTPAPSAAPASTRPTPATSASRLLLNLSRVSHSRLMLLDLPHVSRSAGASGGAATSTRPRPPSCL